MLDLTNVLNEVPSFIWLAVQGFTQAGWGVGVVTLGLGDCLMEWRECHLGIHPVTLPFLLLFLYHSSRFTRARFHLSGQRGKVRKHRSQFTWSGYCLLGYLPIFLNEETATSLLPHPIHSIIMVWFYFVWHYWEKSSTMPASVLCCMEPGDYNSSQGG